MSAGKTRCPVIGLAGGIGSGKSAISGIFNRMGAVIIDADEIAHRVLELPETISGIADVFGLEVIEQGSISRAALGRIVFSDRGLLEKLNRIVHPPVIAECRRIIAASRSDPDCRAVVLDAPLLFEAGLEGLCDATVFVAADRRIRIRRMAASRGWDESELHRREKFQDSLISKRKRADYCIDNNGSLEEAAQQAAVIWQDLVGS